MLKGLGYFLGFLVGGAIITIAINLVFFNRHEATEEEKKQFIANLETITEKIKEEYYESEYNPNKEGFDLGFNYSGKRMSYSRSGGKTLRYIILIYYSPKYKKHLGILSVSEGVNALNRVRDQDYYLTVNKDQMNDSAYGSLQNPVPVFQIKGVTESMREKDQDFDNTYMNKIFHKNINGYLNYIIPEEDFKKLFSKK